MSSSSPHDSALSEGTTAATTTAAAAADTSLTAQRRRASHHDVITVRSIDAETDEVTINSSDEEDDAEFRGLDRKSVHQQHHLIDGRRCSEPRIIMQPPETDPNVHDALLTGGELPSDALHGAGGGGGGGSGGGGVGEDGEHHVVASSTARTMLIVFTICNLLTYFDRGSIGVCLGSIMKPEVYNLSYFQGGILAGSYMFGYISASPFFALAVRKYDPFRIIAFGLSVWALAAICCALSIGFVSLLLARAVSGIGEAAFLCIAPPFIDKCAPSERKSRWMAIFYTAIPLGYALGFVVSGHWLNFYLVPVYYQWRFIFLLEALCMIPFILWCLATETPEHNFKDPPPSKAKNYNKLDELNEPVSYRGPRITQAQRQQAIEAHQQEESSTSAELAEYFETVAEVIHNKVYVLIILGYAAQTFVLGSVAYFGVRYLMDNFGFTIGQAGSYFGGITVIVGVLGSLFGGWLCDFIRAGKNKAHATAVTMKLAFILITIAFPLCLISFLKNSPWYFFSIFVIAEFILFATASPINSAIIWSVPFRLSPLACSLSIMVIHILGDAISPAIIGAILDATHNNWLLTMVLNCCWLVWCVGFWCWAWLAATAKANRIDEEMIARGLGEEHDHHEHGEQGEHATANGVSQTDEGNNNNDYDSNNNNNNNNVIIHTDGDNAADATLPSSSSLLSAPTQGPIADSLRSDGVDEQANRSKLL